MYVGIGLIAAQIPRFIYLCKLCTYVCCGGKQKDTSADRQGLVDAMNALIISEALSAILVILLVLALGGMFTD